MKALSFLPAVVLFLAAIAQSHFAHAVEVITGRAVVVDGDTIEIAGERIRLHGVDAPESWQRCQDGAGRTYRCGSDAAAALDGFLAASRPARCEFVGRDRYARDVGVCFRADGREVNRRLVGSGNAVDWERYSNGAYAGAQTSARSSGLGMWRGKFQLRCEARAAGAHQKPSC